MNTNTNTAASNEPFRRQISFDLLRPHISNPESIAGELFSRWCLPGNRNDRGNGLPALRLAIRDGYLNFYANGRSIAKINSKRTLSLKLHKAYCGEDSRSDYVSKPLTAKDPQAVVNDWMRCAHGHASGAGMDEKRFVENLVAANNNVIDLEMGLPWDERLRWIAKDDKSKPAPRIDLTTVEIRDDVPFIVFWEAKMATNGALRSDWQREGDEGPKVAGQIMKYKVWLDLPGRSDQVSSAYRNSSRILLDLAEAAGKRVEQNHPWRKMAECDPAVERLPGVVVSFYDPAGRSEKYHERLKSFDHHRARLVNGGVPALWENTVPVPPVRVVEIRDRDASHALFYKG